MLIFFFTLIFIAEVKLTLDLVCFIRHLDNKVCSLNRQITGIQPKIKNEITSVRISLNKVLLSLNKAQLKIKEKKSDFKILIVKNFVTSLLFLILNTNRKKIISIIEFCFVIKDFIQKMLKS